MALITCSECNASISDKAQACPKCGHPVVASRPPSRAMRKEATRIMATIALWPLRWGLMLLAAALGFIIIALFNLGPALAFWVALFAALVTRAVFIAWQAAKMRREITDDSELAILWLAHGGFSDLSAEELRGLASRLNKGAAMGGLGDCSIVDLRTPLSKLVVVSLALEDHDAQDYVRLTERLTAMGMERRIKSSRSGTFTDLPTNVFIRTTDEASSDAAANAAIDEVEDALRQLNLSGRVFVNVGDDWAWSCANVLAECEQDHAERTRSQ